MSACIECRSVPGAGERVHRCLSCGRSFCLKCMQTAAGLDKQGLPKFCRSCFRAIRPCQMDGRPSPEPVPESPMFRFSHSKFAHLVDSQQCSSPRSPWSTCRSDEEEDGDESGKHFFSPMSEIFQGAYDTEASSTSTSQELYSFKSVASSPLDSPSRAGDSPVLGSVALLDQETLPYEQSSYCVFDSLSVYHHRESENLQQALDFESNGLIWYPPPPEDEEDDVEDPFVGYDDEDDVVGDSAMGFAPSNFCEDALRLKEKPIDVHKEHLRSAVRGHFRALVSQLLKAEGIHHGGEIDGVGWLDIVSSLAWQAANYVRPDTSKGGSMDPGVYMKVKCISSGSPSDSTLVKGVVCTKNVKHKRMISLHKNPRLLILGGALEFQRVPNKLASINTVLEQEIDDLKKAVRKIEAHRPNVLLVERSVASYAQEYLLTKDISLVSNVKRPLLERISRCTGAQIVPLVDNLATARLGQCENFRLEKVYEESPSGNNSNRKSVKTIMYFEGCPRRLGCTVLLRGACREELRKIKHVVQYASFAAYHLSLETSFLADEGATLPKIPLNSPMALPGKMMHDNNSISTDSGSYIPSASQTVAVNHGNSCTKLGIKCLTPQLDVLYRNMNSNTSDICLQQEKCMVAIEHNCFGDISGSSVTGSRIVLGENNLQVPVDVTIHEIKENLGGSNLCDHKNPMVTNEGKRADRNDGNEIHTEYLSTADPQSILVSFSSRCVLKETVCKRSQLIRIKFYGSFDKPLGRFLHDNLFDQTSCCHNCKEPTEAHVQCYTHRQGSLTISVKRLPSVKLRGEGDGRIWMWHRCLKCERKDGIPPAARRVIMSDAAWGLSFGKFLELSFSNNATANRIASCGHSLQKDCLRFYGFGSMVAFFRYSPVDILSVCLPPSVLDFTQIQQLWVRKEAAEIFGRLEFLHAEVYEVIHSIEQKTATSEYEPLKASIYDHIMELKDLLERERNHYDVLLQSAKLDAFHLSRAAVDILELNHMRRSLLIDSYIWEHRLSLLNSVAKGKGSASKVYPQLMENASEMKSEECRDKLFPTIGTCVSSSEAIVKFLGNSRKSLLSRQNVELSLPVQECESNNLVESDLPIESVEGYVGQAGLSLVSGHSYGYDESQMGAEACVGTSSLERLLSPGSNLSDKIDSAWSGTGHLVSSPPSGGSTESLMDNPFLSRVMRPSRVGSFDSITHRDRIYGLPPASFHLSSVKSFDAFRDFRRMIRDPIPNIRRVYSERSPEAIQSLSIVLSHKPVFISSISQMVSEGARLLIPQTGIDDFVVVVYDNEPTSIICHAISSQEYANFVSNKLDQNEGLIQNEKLNAVADQLGNSMAATAWQSFTQFQSDDIQSRSCGSDEPLALQGNLYLDPKDLHFRLSFDDELSIPDDKVKFSVTCYFAKQFDILRKKCCPNEVDFLRSLSRCRRWSAQGGKSNVYFAKSLDDRFIIKQVTKTELDSFEEFAIYYFKYLMESINSGSPTCLAKVLGIYQVTVKHLKGGREMKMDLMVMENLFFQRNVSRVYDLKGSSRSRYNPDSTGSNKVLLDLNLLETLGTKPIFLERKAKRSLERAVWNDTSFLEAIHVMDYSLLVGIDEKRKELVIGIIDFMRQYTWDKHLESWVKASGILGGPRNASPTVISPNQYKTRFRKAMSKYFLTVPDQWSS